MRLALLLLACLVVAGPAAAAATDWQELAPDTRVRLIASGILKPDGTTLAAIELDMPPGTKTYWRVPGESGIPTELDLTGSTGIAGQQLFWPYPQVEVVGGLTDFVYRDSVVIPVELTVSGQNPALAASLLMGICSDICVPANAAFTLPLDFAHPDPGEDLRIAQALAEIPLAWSGPGEPIGTPVFDAAAGRLEIPVDDTLVDPGSVLVDASASGYLFGAPQKSPQAGLVELPLLASGDTSALDATDVTVLFMTGEGPYEVTKRVARSTRE